jgi:hypothetical protein
VERRRGEQSQEEKVKAWLPVASVSSASMRTASSMVVIDDELTEWTLDRRVTSTFGTMGIF